MKDPKEQFSGFPRKGLVATIELAREDGLENPTLQRKLQDEMSKPLNSELLTAASDSENITKLKAPEVLGAADFRRFFH